MLTMTVPIARFYEDCLQAAERAQYFAVVVLVARKADALGLYHDVLPAWTSLHDLTGDDLLVLFAGRAGKEQDHHGVRHRRESVRVCTDGLEVMPESGIVLDTDLDIARSGIDPDVLDNLLRATRTTNLRELRQWVLNIGMERDLVDDVLRVRHDGTQASPSVVRRFYRALQYSLSTRPDLTDEMQRFFSPSEDGVGARDSLLSRYGAISPLPPRDYDIAEQHSLSVRSLAGLLRQPESVVPFIHITFLHSGRSLVVPVSQTQRETLYGLMKRMMNKAAPIFAQARTRWSELDRLRREAGEKREKKYHPSVRLLMNLQSDFPTGPAHAAVRRMYEIVVGDGVIGKERREEYYRLLNTLKQMQDFPWRQHRQRLQGIMDLRQQLGPPNLALSPPAVRIETLEAEIKALSDRAEDAMRTAAHPMDLARVDMRTEIDCVILTVIPEELSAVCRVFGIDGHTSERELPSGSIFRLGIVRSVRAGRSYRIAIGCLGAPGNYNSSTGTTEAIQALGARCMVLVGIAAGMRGKVRIGQGVISQRVVAYEGGSIEAHGGQQPIFVPRPGMDRVVHRIEQDVTFYIADGPASRIQAKLSLLGGDGQVPSRETCQRVGIDYEEELSFQPDPAFSTLASGEKLLRDESKLKWIREALHGKVEIGEMEAAGFVEACSRFGVPWVIIRGISDFGDDRKCDEFHRYASSVAAATLADFVEYGLRIKGIHARNDVDFGTPAPEGPME